MDEEIHAAIVERLAAEGYAERRGIRLVELGPGRAVVESAPRVDDTNIFGSLHGGAVFSVMDEAFQLSCNSHGRVAVALVMNVVYHNIPAVGRRLRAESREIHRSKKTATYEIRVEDDTGLIIASCQALAYRKKERLPFLRETS